MQSIPAALLQQILSCSRLELIELFSFLLPEIINKHSLYKNRKREIKEVDFDLTIALNQTLFA